MVCPDWAVPEIVGGDVFEGACFPGASLFPALDIETGSAIATIIQTTLVSCGGESLTHTFSAS
jgi:hypothetical protein